MRAPADLWSGSPGDPVAWAPRRRARARALNARGWAFLAVATAVVLSTVVLIGALQP